MAAAATKRKRKQQSEWIAVSSTRAPDPRVSPDSREYGKRLVLVTLLIDGEGQLWERVGRDPPALLGRPPTEE